MNKEKDLKTIFDIVMKIESCKKEYDMLHNAYINCLLNYIKELKEKGKDE